MEVRAQWLRMSIEHIERLRPDQRAAVTARLAPGMLVAVDDVSAFEWLPVEQLLTLDDAIVAVTGLDHYRATARTMLSEDLAETMVGPLFRAAFRVTGVNPAGLLNVVPTAYRLVTRGCGRMRVETASRHAAVYWHEVPSALLASDAYVIGIEAGLEASLTFSGRTGAARRIITGAHDVCFELRF